LNLLFFNFGSGEILLIVLAVFLVFGPDKLPGLARNLGKFINDMKRATEDIKTEINREADRYERGKKLTAYKEKVKTEENNPAEQKTGNEHIADKIKKPEDSTPKSQ